MTDAGSTPQAPTHHNGDSYARRQLTSQQPDSASEPWSAWEQKRPIVHCPCIRNLKQPTSQMKIESVDSSGPVPIVYIDVPLMPNDRRPRPANARPADRQRRRVYRWESSQGALGASFGLVSDLDEMREWIAQIWPGEAARYGVPGRSAPAVRTPTARQKHAVAHVKRGTICIPTAMRTRWVILHELAHHLAAIGESSVPRHARLPHGPTFVGVLIGLLHRHLGLEIEFLRQSAGVACVEVDIASIDGRTPGTSASRRDKAQDQSLIPPKRDLPAS